MSFGFDSLNVLNTNANKLAKNVYPSNMSTHTSSQNEYPNELRSGSGIHPCCLDLKANVARTTVRRITAIGIQLDQLSM